MRIRSSRGLRDGCSARAGEQGGRVHGEHRTAEGGTELRSESFAAGTFRAGQGEFTGCVGGFVRLRVQSDRHLCLHLGQQIGVKDGEIRYRRGFNNGAPVFECRVEPALFANGADKSFISLPCGGDAPCRSVGEGVCKTPAQDIGQGQVRGRCVG